MQRYAAGDNFLISARAFALPLASYFLSSRARMAEVGGVTECSGVWAYNPTQKFIARRYRTTEANLHHWLKKHGLKPPPARPIA